MRQLNEDQRDVFVLAELEELSAPEIATVLGTPLNTVYVYCASGWPGWPAEFGKGRRAPSGPGRAEEPMSDLNNW